MRNFMSFLVLSGFATAAFGGVDFGLKCGETYGPKLNIRVVDQKLLFSLRDTVTADYGFVQELFHATGRTLPANAADADFSIDTVVPADPESLDLTLGVSQFLPGFGRGLIDASSVYKEIQPVVPVDISLIQGSTSLTSFRSSLTFAMLETRLREVHEEFATQTSATTQDMSLSLTLFNRVGRADLTRVFSPFTCEVAR